MEGGPLASSEDLLTHSVAELGHGGVLAAEGGQKLKELILPEYKTSCQNLNTKIQAH